MKVVKYLVLTIICLLSSLHLSLADTRTEHFVSLNGAGSKDGSSWSNAWNQSDFNSSGNWGTGESKISPGETVYFDGGTSSITYTVEMSPQANGGSGSPITFKPGAAHSTLSANHDGVVIFSKGIENGSYKYLTWDGEWSGSDYNALDGMTTLSFKFKVTEPTSSGVHYKGSYNIFKFLEVYNVGDTLDGDHGFFCNPTSGLEPIGIEIGYCYIHDGIGDGINQGRSNSTDTNNIIIHHCYIVDNAVDCIQISGGFAVSSCRIDAQNSTGGTHGDGIQASKDNIKINNNIFVGCPQSIFIESRDIDQANNFYIYNNIFYPGNYSYNLGITLKLWRYKTSGNMTLNNAIIANNTFDTLLSRQAIEFQNSTGATMAIRNSKVINNIFYNIDYANVVTAPSGDYTDFDLVYKNNIFYQKQSVSFNGVTYTTVEDLKYAHPEFTGNKVMKPIFKDYANHNYSLSSEDTACIDGAIQSDIFSTDIIDANRSLVWDIGAYEYKEYSLPHILISP